MTKPDLSADIAAFLARGGVIHVAPMGATTDAIARLHAEARARERGVVFDYTAYSMNRGEGANHADAVNFATGA